MLFLRCYSKAVIPIRIERLEGELYMIGNVKVSRIASSSVLLIVLGVDLPARAGLVIDQHSTASNNALSIAGSTILKFGQSFTPTLDSIDFATFNLGSSLPSTFRVDLLSGGGLGGAVLDSSSVQSLDASPRPSVQPVEFDFSSPIALNPGGIYTLVVIQTSPLTAMNLSATGSLGNPYAGGRAYGSLFSTFDFAFGEGIHTAAVPEPSSLALLVVGLTTWLGIARLQRRRAA